MIYKLHVFFQMLFDLEKKNIDTILSMSQNAEQIY